MSLSFYRKYRPRKFADLDLDRVRAFFERVLSSGQFAHSYLFAGPKGTGKTSAARILAMVVNCELNSKHAGETGKSGEVTGPLQEPCGKCDNCMAIARGTSSSVVEIDAASNRGIDDIRALRQRVGLVPTQGKYSVYIIDEVHMLTKEAFNALLKTLEEPPARVIFCLCTTEEHKLPDTIISRCTKVAYYKASEAEMVRSLKRVVAGEKIAVDEEALATIAVKVDGSFRDGTKVLEQLAGSEDKITREMVLAEIGDTASGEVRGLLELVLAGDASGALAVVKKLEEQNMDMKLLAQNLITEAKGRLVEKLNNEGLVDGGLMKLIEVMSKSFSRFADVPIASLPVEMAVVEYCVGVGSLKTSGSDSGSSPVKQASSTLVGITNNPSSSTKQIRKTNDQMRKTDDNKLSESSGEEGQEVGGDESVRKSSHKITEDAESVTDNEDEKAREESDLQLVVSEVEGKWGEVLGMLETKNHGLVTILRGTRVRECAGNKLVLAVGYKFHKERLEQDRYLRMVEDIMTEVFGGRVRLAFELEEIAKVTAKEVVHENVSGIVPPEDVELVKAAEEIFG